MPQQTICGVVSLSPSSCRTQKDVKNFIGMVKNTILEYEMIKSGDKVLIALSGGPDSVCLMRVIMELQYTLGIKNLGVAHLNHMLRKEGARQDQQFAAELAEQYQIPFFTKNIDVKSLARSEKLSIEAAGRKARYDFFYSLTTSHGFTKIATGHNRDDNTEQVLMALLRGAGPTGMKGIVPVRNKKIIRPLIKIPKSSIKEFLQLINQNFIIDCSNEDPIFLRNRIRNHLIPLLEKDYNPNIKETINRNAFLFQEDELFWKNLVEDALPQCLYFYNDKEVRLKISALENMHPALMKRILRKAISLIKTNLYKISLVHIKDIQKLMTESIINKSLDLPGQIRVYKKPQMIIIKKETLPLRKLGKTK